MSTDTTTPTENPIPDLTIKSAKQRSYFCPTMLSLDGATVGADGDDIGCKSRARLVDHEEGKKKGSECAAPQRHLLLAHDFLRASGYLCLPRRVTSASWAITSPLKWSRSCMPPSPSAAGAPTPPRSSLRLGRRFSDSGIAAAVKSLVIDRVRKPRGATIDVQQHTSPTPSIIHDSTPSDVFDDLVLDEDGDDDLVHVPDELVAGVYMRKVNAKTIKERLFRLDPDRGHILYASKKSGIVAVENIKEIRTDGPLSSVPSSHKFPEHPLWLSIIHVTGLKYRALNLLVPTEEMRQLWINTLRTLVRQRREMMGLPLALTVGSDEDCESSLGTGNTALDAWERRRKAWLRRCWKSAEVSGSGRLQFQDVEALCSRLGVCSSREDLSKLFKEADTLHRGELDFADFRRFISLLRRRPDVQKIYDEVLGQHGGGLGVFTWDVFLRFSRNYQKDTREEDELQKIFMRYAVPLPSHENTPTSRLQSRPSALSSVTSLFRQSFSEFSEALHLSHGNVQSNTISSPTDGLHLSSASFSSFLLSLDNSPLVGSTLQISEDMNRPLSDYYISSSHNTYLVGHQLVGDSTVEGYIRALLQGCRSVEIDLYDGDNGPIITHGRSLITSVPLRDVAHAIAKYAFVASPYPVIISAEVHCSLQGQDEIAEILKAVLGDMLVTEPVDARDTLTELPSPEALKYRILLKAKNLYIGSNGDSQNIAFVADEESSSNEASSPSDLETQLHHESTISRLVRGRLKGRSSSESDVNSAWKSSSSTSQDEEGTVMSESTSSPPNSPPSLTRSISEGKPKMSPMLLALLVYTIGVRWRGLNKKEHYAVEHMFSLSERVAKKLVKSSMYELIKHTRSHLVRIYPSGTRVSSTNFEPQKYWAAGAQLVAINWQTSDLGFIINCAMFSRNGRCGYVPKPIVLSTKDRALLTVRKKMHFNVTVISAQQLGRPDDELSVSPSNANTKSTMDPFVDVSLHWPDWPASLGPLSTFSALPPTLQSPKLLNRRTKVVYNNGFNPVWEESFSLPFECIGDSLDLVFVHFAIRLATDSEDHRPLAVYCSSLANLQPGYRHLPLHDVQMSPYLFSTLFVSTNVNEDL